MPQATVKQKTIDPVTGSDVVKKRVFKIDPGSPYNSIVFHRIADLLGVNMFDRTDSHISRKVAVIYNYISGVIKDNSPNKILNAIENYKSNMGVTFEGRDLVKHIYRNIRLEADATNTNKSTPKTRGVSGVLKGDTDRARELRRTMAKQGRRYDKSLRETQSRVKDTIARHVKEVEGKDNIKVKIIKEKSTSVEVPIGDTNG